MSTRSRPRPSSSGALAATGPEDPPSGPSGYEQAATFRAALARFAYRVENTCRKWGLTTDKYTLLVMIRGTPGGDGHTTAKELAQRLRLSTNTVAERLQRAEAEGLIRRDRSTEDRRVAHIRLTPEGERRLKRAFRDLQRDAELVNTFGEAMQAFSTEQLHVRIT